MEGKEGKDLTAQYFLSSLSHEIRTPLNGIVGYTQLLLDSKLNSTQKTYLNSMNQCCLQLMQLINDVLDFSKLATGKMHVNSECLSFREIIDEINSALGYRFKEKKQKCQYILSKELPEYIISDKTKIVQILMNLVSNANKFTGVEGSIIVSILPKDSGIIEFSVEDTGMGIDKEHHGKLFEPFYQVHESISKNSSGLGLTICKKLTEILGGKIGFTSEKGKGSTFTFTIKYQPYEEFQKRLEIDSKILKGKLVLIVDDNVDNRVIIGEMLFESKMRPVICSSAKEAIRMVKRKRYNFSVALIDICMPDISGTELAKQIKELEPEITIVALSSLDESIDMKYFHSMIRKPLNKMRVLDCLMKIYHKGSIEECIIRPVEEKKEERYMAPIVPIPKKKEGIRILVAEDISYNLVMLVKMLESMGYKNIDKATDGEQAINKIDTEYEHGNPYDILLLDLKMPKIDGFAVADYILKKGYVYPKIAVLSASILENDKKRCASLGINYFILKPINMTHLRKVLEILLAETQPDVFSI